MSPWQILLCTAAVAVLTGAATPAVQNDLWIAPVTCHVCAGSAPQSDSADAVGVVISFRAALARGDSVAVLGLLAPDVIIMEAGGIETLAEYRSHHLPADLAYARAIPGVHTLKRAVVRGDAAWVSSTSVAEGHCTGRAVNSVGAELVVLSRRAPGAPWSIRAVHWSSRRRTR